MANFYLNSQTQTNGDHEVHTEQCRYLPAAVNRIALGSFSDCKHAVVEAKSRYSKARSFIKLIHTKNLYN